MIYPIVSLGFLFLMNGLGAVGILTATGECGSRRGRGLLSFSIGIMIATATFSLLVPAINLGVTFYDKVLVVLGFILGCIMLVLIDLFTDGESKQRAKTKSFIIAMALHNIPEGIAVALAFNVAMTGHSSELLGAAIILAIGVGIQNVPESYALALTIYQAGYKKSRAILTSILAGVVEPVFGIVALVFNNSLTAVMPLLLAYAAGTMLHVTIEELIPDIMNVKNRGPATVGIMFGILVMIIMEMV